MPNLSSVVFYDSTKMNHPNCDIEYSSLLECLILSIYTVSDVSKEQIASNFTIFVQRLVELDAYEIMALLFGRPEPRSVPQS